MKDRLCFGKMCLKLEALEVAKIPISPLKLLAVQVEVGKSVIHSLFNSFTSFYIIFFSIYDDFRILGFIYFVMNSNEGVFAYLASQTYTYDQI